MQETALRAVSCTHRNPLGATRGPALFTEPGVAMGLGAGAGSERIAHPGPPDLLLCARADLCRSSPVCGLLPDLGRWTGQVHRPRPRGTTLMGTPGYAVPGPAPRPTRTDPGPEGHVRRESREAWGGEGGGRAASLGPSAGACALSEPDRRWATARGLSSRVKSPGFDAPYSSGSIWVQCL